MVSKLRKAILGIGVLALVLGVVACGAQVEGVYTEVSSASISPGSPIPVPSEDVILTFSGRLRVTNVGDTLQLDMPTLESMGLVEYTVNDPYSGVDVVYTGVLMSQISKYVGASKPWDTFRIVALDDYQVEINFPDIERWPILLATKADGEYMTVENAGPTRIIYPYDSFPELDPLEYNDLWIWNIATMQVN